MTDDGIPSMTALAPIIDQLGTIAEEELPSPYTAKIELWDDGDYRLWFYHSLGEDEREQIDYDTDTGTVTWRYMKGPRWNAEFVSPEYGTRYTPTFEESEERVITTIEPPV